MLVIYVLKDIERGLMKNRVIPYLCTKVTLMFQKMTVIEDINWENERDQQKRIVLTIQQSRV